MDTLTWQELNLVNSSSDVRSISNSRESVQGLGKDSKAVQNVIGDGASLPKNLASSRIRVGKNPSLLTLDNVVSESTIDKVGARERRDSIKLP